MPIGNKKVHPVSLGCAKNLVDSEKALAEALSVGYKITGDPLEADLILINTCGFIESAKEESIETILSLAIHKRRHQRVIVYGCLSERYKTSLAKTIPEVDVWLGTYKQGKILEQLEQPKSLRARGKNLPFARTRLEYPHHAYLKISEGCNRACAFCAIPLIRGKQASASINDLVAEAKMLEKSGVKELALVAQDLISYGLDLKGASSGLSNGAGNANLTMLLENLLKKTNIPWIRLMYLYPENINGELLNLMASEPRICKYADIPIQHASDKILKLMRRKSRVGDLRDLFQNMRESVKGISLRTTLLLGFPGETHEDFEELMRFVEDTQFEHLGGFIWSPEEQTAAVRMRQERVPEDIARARLDMLIERQEEISLEKSENLIGKKINVMLDEVADESEFHFYGRTQGDALEIDNIVRILEGNGEVGEIKTVKIVDANAHELDGVIL